MLRARRFAHGLLNLLDHDRYRLGRIDRRVRLQLERLEERCVPSYVLTDLSSFSSLGGRPSQAGLIEDSNGNFFGTTSQGGLGFGTVFEWVKATDTISILASFNGTNGNAPLASLIEDSSGNLFGTAANGGISGQGGPGTLFEVRQGSGTITVLANFGASIGGSESGLIEDASGNLFGAGTLGGANGDGGLFEWTKSTGTLSLLASFNGTNGASPIGNLVEDSSGDLFGVCNANTPSSGNGTIFEWVKGSTAISLLGSFNGTNGSGPVAGLMADGSGNLFGTTSRGGAFGDGTVFEWLKSSGTITTLASFNGSDGSEPFSSLVEDSSGDLFGTTVLGAPTMRARCSNG